MLPTKRISPRPVLHPNSVLSFDLSASSVISWYSIYISLLRYKISLFILIVSNFISFFFWSNFWIHLISKLKLGIVESERKREKRGEKEIEIFDRGIRTFELYFGQRCSSVESRVNLIPVWKLQRKKIFRHGFKGMKGTSLSMNEWSDIQLGCHNQRYDLESEARIVDPSHHFPSPDNLFHSRCTIW